MAKTLGLKQLAQKKYTLVEGIPEEFVKTIGKIEDAFDVIIYGPSGNGKSNFTAQLIKALLKALGCRCEYVAYEEGHGMTIQETFISRHNLLEELGNVMNITDHLSFEELNKKMGAKQSPKIWVIDSIQASGMTAKQFAYLKEKYVLSRKKKILIAISWAEGKRPAGAAAKSIEFYANVKLRVEGLIVFPKSRYGGNQNYVIWEGNETQGAMAYWGKKYWKVAGKTPPSKKKAVSKKKEEIEVPVAELA